MQDVYIIGATRTAIGSFEGSLKKFEAHQLGAVVIREAVRRAGIQPGQVDEVILGNILGLGQGQGPGRQAAMAAGIPQEVPAWTINQLCGSGLKTVALATDAIRSGEADCIVAGGMESMSRAPHLATFVRGGTKMGHVQMLDSMMHDALTDAFSGEHMGMTAEWIADRYEITREEQDAFAAESQRKAQVALTGEYFSAEIVPVEIPQRKADPVIFVRDEYPRATTVEKLSGLKPAFRKEGSVTAGNASGINDGAAALVVASKAFVDANGLKPLAKIISHATTGLDPAVMGLGPISATRKALSRAGWTAQDLDRIEANEAFAVQSLAVVRDLELNPEKVNVNGGAIALGHPVGASGARILVTLLYELERSGLRKGLATLCVGGGMGVAMLIERV